MPKKPTSPKTKETLQLLEDQANATFTRVLNKIFWGRKYPRDYGTGAQVLADLGVRSMRLLTNNPSKRAGLEGYQLSIVGRVPLPVRVTADNIRYLTTKRDRMGHDLPNLPAAIDEEVTEASADALPTAVSERAARLEPEAVQSALRLAHALSPFALPVDVSEQT